MASSIAFAACPAVAGKAVVKASAKAPRAAAAAPVRMSAEQPMDRRAALAAAAGAFALSRAQPAEAAYGQSANVFKKSQEKKSTDYSAYIADNYVVQIPQRGYNPSPQGLMAEWSGVLIRWEDFNATDYANVTVTEYKKADLPSVEDIASLGMLGEATWDGFGEFSGIDFTTEKSRAINAVNVLDAFNKDVNGTKYVVYELLSRTVDGSQGGRHHLISAAKAKDGKVYICKYTCGDKHWAVNRPTAFAVRDTFIVA